MQFKYVQYRLFDKSVAHFKNAHTVKKEKIKCILLYFRWFFMKGKYCGMYISIASSTLQFYAIYYLKL